MNGYLRPLAPDRAHGRLLMSYQCGLCHHIGATYGFPYRILAGPDLVFYNLFLDVVGGALAAEGQRPCVLTPGVLARPCREAGPHTRIAAAFGVWMAVEKLRDDAADDGGLVKWLAARAFAPGAARAREILREEGFPVEDVAAWMAAQARVERDSAVTDLAAAVAPTAAIGRLTFGFAARHAARPEGDAVASPPVATPALATPALATPALAATALVPTRAPCAATPAGDIGEALGRYLFWMDNLLDYGRDVASGGYNALARAYGARDALPDEARATALAGARDAVADLRDALATLEVAGDRRWLAKVLVDGLSDKVRRWVALPLAARAKADLREITPPSRLRLRLRRVFDRFETRARTAAALAVLWAFPRLARAQDTAAWWPTDAGDLGLDTADTGALPDGEPAAEAADVAFSHQPLDIVCGNVGSCDPDGCGDACGDACGDVCDDTCDIGCSGIDCC